MVALITYVFPDGHEGPPSPLLQIPSIFVQHEDADGEIWEEPEQRRSRRMRGLRSEHHLGRLSRSPHGQIETLPRESFEAAQLPIRVRCPRCRWVSVVDRDHLQDDIGRSTV